MLDRMWCWRMRGRWLWLWLGEWDILGGFICITFIPSMGGGGGGGGGLERASGGRGGGAIEEEVEVWCGAGRCADGRQHGRQWAGEPKGHSSRSEEGAEHTYIHTYTHTHDVSVYGWRGCLEPTRMRTGGWRKRLGWGALGMVPPRSTETSREAETQARVCPRTHARQRGPKEMRSAEVCIY